MRASKYNALDLLKYISDSINERGYAPSLREAQASLAWSSVSQVSSVLTDLEGSGYIIRAPRRARAIRVTDMGARVLLGGL